MNVSTDVVAQTRFKIKIPKNLRIVSDDPAVHSFRGGEKCIEP